jgi:IclR family transcriptional regulator, KDG regulon repressor
VDSMATSPRGRAAARSSVNERASNASPSTDRAITVMETLIESDEPLTLTALAREAHIPLATCASIVQTLEQRGYATRRIIGRSHFWRPTLRLYSLSSRLIRGVDSAQIAQPHLRRLCDQLSVPAHLGVLDGQYVVYVAKAAAPGLIQFNTFPGKVSTFHLTALGRAIAAYLPDTELKALLADRLASGTGPKSRGSSSRWLKAELELTRKRGYSVEDEEEQAEIGCIAAPVFGADERVACAIGVTGFSRELLGERLDAAVAAVVQAAQALSADLGSTGGYPDGVDDL